MKREEQCAKATSPTQTTQGPEPPSLLQSKLLHTCAPYSISSGGCQKTQRRTARQRLGRRRAVGLLQALPWPYNSVAVQQGTATSSSRDRHTSHSQIPAQTLHEINSIFSASLLLSLGGGASCVVGWWAVVTRDRDCKGRCGPNGDWLNRQCKVFSWRVV